MAVVSALTFYAVLRYDPSRTLTMRNAFAREMRVMFRNVASGVRNAVIEQNALSLVGRSSADVMNGFLHWLEGRVNATVRPAVVDRYVELAYQQGVMRARSELAKAGYTVPTIEASGGVWRVMQTRFHQDALALLRTRAYNDLRAITDNMQGQVARVLAQALTEGQRPREIARLLSKVIVGPAAGLTRTLGRFMPAMRRSELLARSEVVRSHHSANVTEYRAWAVKKVRVQAEWVTAQDGHVCPECQAMEGKIFDLDEIEGMIPLHVQCRCVALPVEA